jgi:hypothetical protein
VIPSGIVKNFEFLAKQQAHGISAAQHANATLYNISPSRRASSRRTARKTNRSVSGKGRRMLPAFPGRGGVALLWALGILIFTAVTSWIIGVRMRREIKRDLGRKATDADLTSLETWMEVDEVENRNRAHKPPMN